MISYAQNFEDVILNRVFSDCACGFYIDVGAMDPTSDSVTKSFYDRGWRGINIEPNVEFYGRLLAERGRDVNLNVAVGDANETRLLSVFEGSGLSTLDPEFRNISVEHGFSYREITCNVLTLAEICRRHVEGQIDFLKIDAEGWEKQILHGGDWVRFRPTVLLIEAIHPFVHTPEWASWEPFLTVECKYNFVYFDGVNRFYVPREREELAQFFSRPACVLDGFQLYASAEAERRAALLQGEVEQIRFSEEALRRDLAAERSRAQTLAKELRHCRFWIGRLSEQLAAAKRRTPN